MSNKNKSNKTSRYNYEDEEPEHSDEKIAQVKKSIADVKIIMKENVEKSLIRGEKLEQAVEQSDKLKGEAEKFRKGASQLKCQMIKNHYKLILGLILLVLILILIFYFSLKNSN